MSKRSQSGFLNYNAVKKIHLASMSREYIISEGSGDAISLAIFGDPVNGIRVAVGSLCDENTQYNMPGNLRLWTSDNENCLSLRGHKTPNEENGQGRVTSCGYINKKILADGGILNNVYF